MSVTSMRVTRKTFAVDQLALSYVDAQGGGMPVVFQHGLCGAMEQTTEAFPQDTGARLLTLECRGHGQSELGDPQALSITTFAADVSGLVQHLGLGPVVMGGISMGAAIALQLAVQRPELVRALIIARPAWSYNKAPPNMQPNLVVGQFMQRLPQGEAKQAFLNSPTAQLLRTTSPDNLVSLTGFFDREPVSATAALLQRISEDGPAVTAADLRKLDIPCLVIGHRDDVIHPLVLAKGLADLIPRAQFVEITPKTVSKALYLRDMHHAIQQFLKGISHA